MNATPLQENIVPIVPSRLRRTGTPLHAPLRCHIIHGQPQIVFGLLVYYQYATVVSTVYKTDNVLIAQTGTIAQT